MQKKNIKEQINEFYDKMPPICKKVAKYVNDNYPDSLLLSSSELAKAAGVSHTTVIRYTRILGYSGFLEYKKSLKDEYMPKQRVYSYLRKMQMDDGGGYLSAYFAAMQTDLNKFLASLDTQVLDNFCDYIMNSKILYIMGLGSDCVVVDFLKNYLVLMGIRVIPVYEEGLSLREKLLLIDQNDTLLLIGYPTLTKDEHWACDFAREKKANLLLITDSELTAKSLHIENFACMMETSDIFFNSYILPLTFCNALLLRLYEKNPEEIRRNVASYQQAIQ